MRYLLFLLIFIIGLKAEVNLNNPLITFTFDNKLFKTKEIGQFTNKPLMLCDGLSGSFEYISQSGLKLYPNEKLKASEIYKCQTNRDFFDFNKSFEIKTESFKLQSINRVDDKLEIEFNDIVNFNSLNQNLLLTNIDTFAKVGFDLSPKVDSKSYIVNITTHKNIQNLKVNISKELNSIYSKKLIDNFEKEFLKPKESSEKFNKLKELLLYNVEPTSREGEINLLVRYFSTSGTNFINQNMSKFIEVFPKVNFTFKRDGYTYSKKLNRYTDSFLLKGDFKPNTTYTINFKKGLSTFHNILKENRLFEVKTENIEPFVEFSDNKNRISTIGELKLKSVNFNKLKVVVDRLLDDNYRYFVNFSRADKYYFGQFSEVLSTSILAINSKQNRSVNSYLDISKYMSEAGIYRVRLYSTNKKDSKLYDEKVIFISDIAISAKISNNQLFVMTNSLKNASSLAGTNIKVYAKNNKLLFEGKSSNDGVFIREVDDFIAKEPVAIVAQNGNDKNFLLINPKKTKTIKNRYRAFIFLERSIYRPNDELNFAVSIKNEKFDSLKDKPIKIVIKDSTQKEILNESLKTDKLGVVTKKLTIEHFFKTGRYTIYIYFANKRVGYSEFFVEDFIPEQIKTTIKLDKDEYFLNEYIKASVNTNYLFGTKASGLSGEAKLNASKMKFYYDGYSFDSDEETKEFKFKEVTKRFKLDENANANLIFHSNIIGKPTSILSAMVGVTIFDGGRGVSTYKRFKIYPFKEMVGVKRLSKGEAKVNGQERFKTIILNPITKEETKREVEIEIHKIVWNYNYTNGYSWSKNYEFVDKFKVVAGEEFKFTPKSSGEYIVTIKDSHYNHKATTKFNVSGFDFSPITPRESIKDIILNFEDREYSRGEELNITIDSPIKGKLLLTFESDRVFKYKFYDLNQNKMSISEKLDFIFDDGFYISAYVIRGTAIHDSTLSFRAEGSAYIKANMDRYKIKANLTHPKVTKSKSKFKIDIDIDTSKESLAIISIVDEGILQILNEKLPNPFEYFYTKKQNSVRVFDFYDDVLSSYIKSNALAFGGDLMRAEARMKKHMPPKNINKRIEPFSIFKVVKVKNQKASVEVDIPNFNGKAKIIAFIVNGYGVGIASSSFVVKDKIIIKPTYPKFLIEGDSLEVPLSIFNESKEKHELKIESKNIEVTQNSDSLKIKAIKEGDGYIKLSMSEYFHEVHIPIYSNKTLISKSFIGESDKRVVINREFQNPQATIGISNSYLKSLKGEFNNLINYPYGCLEQTSSKLLSLLNLEKFIDANISEKTLLLKEREVFIRNAILKLQDMQLSSGAFSYWENSSSFNKFASIYAIDTLLTLRDSGFEVPMGMLTKAINYLQNTIKDASDKRNLFYSLWLLSKEGFLIDSVINMAYDSNFYRGNLLLTSFMITILDRNGFINEARGLLNELNYFDLNSMSSAREYGDSFYSKIRDIAFAYYLLINHKDEPIAKRLFKYIKQNIKVLSSTQERAFVFKALSEHYKSLSDESISVLAEFNGETLFIDKESIIETNLTTDVILTPKKKSVVNYAVDMFDYINAPLNSEIKSSFYAKRNFIDESAKEVDLNALNLGDLIYLKLDLRAKSKIENVAVVNKIPSCLESINTRISSFKPKFKDVNYRPDYVDIRDDRIISFLTLDKNTTFYLPLRVSFKGECKMRETNIEAMYDSSLNGYLKEVKWIVIK